MGKSDRYRADGLRTDPIVARAARSHFPRCYRFAPCVLHEFGSEITFSTRWGR